MDTSLLLIALIPAPLTLLLFWVIMREVRGVPAFQDSAPPQPGQLDKLGRWVLGLVCLFLGGIAYWKGGVVGVLALASLIAVVATAIALLWTIAQTVRDAFKQRQTVEGVGSSSIPLAPVHRRFARNFRRTIVGVPGFFANFWW